MRPLVVYWNNIPSPYVVERFNALVDRDKFDFEAWFNDRINADRSWTVDESTWRFRYRYLPTTHIAGRTFHWPLPVLGRRPDILVSLYAEPAFLVGWAIARLRGAKTCFRVLMTHDRWVKRHAFKESLKRFIFRRVDAIETPGNDGRKYAMRYGAAPDKIFYATHTVDIDHYQVKSAIARLDRQAIRNKLDLKGITFIYVGRLWWGKGINILLNAFESVQRQSTDEVSLLLVGDGPEETRLKQVCSERNIRNVVFAGFKQKPDLPKYYAIADVFVFPTLGDPYGLVVDEAMACSLPVISTRAAGEIRDRIEEGVNGYIVPPDDSAALAERMLHMSREPLLRAQLGKASAEKIAQHTPDHWAEDIEVMVYDLLYRR